MVSSNWIHGENGREVTPNGRFETNTRLCLSMPGGWEKGFAGHGILQQVPFLWYVIGMWEQLSPNPNFGVIFFGVQHPQNLDQSVLAPHRKNHGIATTSAAPAAGCGHLCARLRWNSWDCAHDAEPHRQEGGELHPIGCHWTSGDFICHLAILGPHVLEILGVSKCWDDNYSQRSTFARQINVKMFIFRRFSRWTSGPHSSNRRKRVV